MRQLRVEFKHVGDAHSLAKHDAGLEIAFFRIVPYQRVPPVLAINPLPGKQASTASSSIR